MTTFINSLMLLIFLIPSVMWSQQTVSGTITDENDAMPLAGVNILIKGTKTGSVTDFDGEFSINAEKGDVLVFSYMGYKTQELPFAGQRYLDVVLKEDAGVLDEIILIGYGSTSKRYATGSVNQISTEDFNKGPNTAPEQLLMGKVPGLQITPNSGAPGSGAKITIRGGSSLNAVNEPLFVIDGVPMDNGSEISGSDNPLNYINPNDIESMSVLKDASATAIYGARASNGVVMITTKKGTTTKGLKVNVAYSTSVSHTISTINTLNADQFRDLVKKNSNADAIGLLGTENTDWQDQIFQSAVAQDAYVSLRGSIDEKLPFRFSMGYNNEDGVLKTGNFERVTSSIGLSPTFFDDHLSLEANIKGSYEENKFADNGAISSAYRFDPTQPVYSGEERFGGYWEWIDKDDDKPNANASSNPLGRLNLTDNHSYVNRSVGNLKTDYKFHFLPELKATVNIGYDYSESNGFLSIPTFARKEYNIKKPEEGGIYENRKQIKRNTLFDMYLNYKKSLSALNSSIDVTAGYSYQKFTVDNDNLKQNYNREITNFDNRAAYDRVLIGFFGRLNYSFTDKYLLTATLRRDATSRFAKDQRWGWFPSLALAWRLNEENFIKNSNTVSDLKLRLSWGITGQENLGNNPYPFLPVYQTSNNQYSYYPMGTNFVPTLRPNIYDPNIKWEEQTTYNVGLDFGFFKNTLYGSFDVYQKTTDDLLQKVGAPMPNLNNEITTNVGSMTNKGVEFALGAELINTEVMKWNVNMNASYNENKISKISFGEGLQFYQTGSDISGGTGNKIQVNMLDKSAQSFYVYEQVYDTNGKPIEGAYVDRNDDGIINEQDLRIFHSPRPKWMLGLSSNVAYKNWDLEFSARANFDNYVYNNLKADMGIYSALSGSKGYLSNVHADILNTGFEDRQYFSDYYIENASFLKLDYLTIGYTLNFLKDINLRINGSVQNVFTITGYDGLDPEIGDGIDNYSYARPRTYSVGLNVNF